jgi:hypothetical protein
VQDNAGNDEEPFAILFSSTTFTIPPPPGLSLTPPIPELPDLKHLEALVDEPKLAACDASPRKVPLPLYVESMPIPQRGYQVLLRDLSESMAQEPMLRAMLEQAGLDDDVMRLDFRPMGKALMEFRSLASVHQCISHFHDRPWGNAGARISALFVRTVKGACAPIEKTTCATATKALSADAPVFVPSAPPSAATLAAPLPEKIDNVRPRVCSAASTTAAGAFSDDASENCDSESDEGGPPDDPIHGWSLENE